MRFHNLQLIPLSLVMLALTNTVFARKLDCWRFTNNGDVAFCENPFVSNGRSTGIGTICQMNSCTARNVTISGCSLPGNTKTSKQQCYSYGPSPASPTDAAGWRKALTECRARTSTVEAPFTCKVSLNNLPKISCTDCYGYK
ncbi:secreted protein [Melampsora americana]|nr:secreted protein [Melampsora americana]